MAVSGSRLSLVAGAIAHGGRTAIADAAGEHSYARLLDRSARAAAALLQGRRDLEEARVAFFVPPGFTHVAIQWGIWRAGGIAVPLALSYPPAELDYVIRDAEVSIVVADPAAAETLRPLAEAAGARLVTTTEALSRGAAPDGMLSSDAREPEAGALPDVVESRRAMMVYTSGTTGKPKGVVTTHANLRAQITALIEAWGWTEDDRILLVLPLHHVHGIVNVVCSSLRAGAVCEMLPRFDAEETWARIASGRLTLFMAVPTIYRRLIAAWEAARPERRTAMSEGCRRMRLMVSGSAALPVRTLERWREISGHTLLERYGMTELGMALSNPLHGERRPGYVGAPLPGVLARLVDEAGAPVADGAPGEIEVRGPNVFLEYWRRPDATRDAFRDGWFRTGDTAVVEDGYYRILGRSSVDIIKTGGFKVSALEIEEELRTHPAVAECAVVGVDDPDWGERICAAVELRDGGALELGELQGWAKERLAPYKVPRALRCVDALPRNAMGKVMKPEVAKLFGGG
ncbi:MAG TPA: acyl-CoA synthetase [Gemmatimonadales bacterium]|jgi:malonyl-CoA/methylmalonyl-CoA synthetase|nr:acyl-CoA synthetase [Gemmatimonadales bacterium]